MLGRLFCGGVGFEYSHLDEEGEGVVARKVRRGGREGGREGGKEGDAN